MLDLTAIPIVDAHAHPLYVPLAPLGPDDLEQQVGLLAAHSPRFLFSESYFTALAGAVGPQRAALDQEHDIAATWAAVRRAAGSTVFFHLFRKRLGAFLGVEPTVEALTAARNSVVSDTPAYLRRLIADAGITQVVIDEGMPRPLDLDAYRAAMPVPVASLRNLSELLGDLLAERLPFVSMVERYTGAVRDAIEHEGYVGFKSHVAYTSGLAITAPGDDEARTALAAQYQGDPGARNVLDSYFIRLALRDTRRMGVPVQFHTGLGGVGISMNRCNPLLLEALLKDDALRGAPIVLLHSGWPWAAEAGWLANAFPAVHVDISFELLYAHANVQHRLRALLELAPLSKVTYGSDAYLFPELHWLSAHQARRHLGAVLGEFVREDSMSLAEAERAAAAVLHENAIRLYRLDPSPVSVASPVQDAAPDLRPIPPTVPER